MKLLLKMARNLAYDGYRYVRYSSTLARPLSRSRLEAHVRIDGHRIEKGLALPMPRPGFGKDVVQRLIRNVTSLEEGCGSTPSTAWAVQALREYHSFSTAAGDYNPELDEFLTKREQERNSGGTVTLHADEVIREAAVDFLKFARSRRSVREFSDAPVAGERIAAAVLAAERTPSVCNRQSAKAYRIQTPDVRRRLLEIQGGNRGFGEQIPELIVVTSELRTFVTVAERYQAWIDGGLYAMSLVYALHAQGLATCMLNWSVDPARDRAARKVMNLARSENIIVFIAIGHYPRTFRVAVSPRHNELLQII